MLMLDVTSHGSFSPLSMGGNIVSISPEDISPQHLFQLRKLLPNLIRGSSLDQVHDLGGRMAGLGRQKQMHMIGLNPQLHDLKLIDLDTKMNHLLQTFFQSSLQDTFTIFGNPNEMVLDVVAGVRGGFEHLKSIATSVRCRGRAAFISGLKRPEFSPAYK